MVNFVITIDGPAASGKSTVARLLAEKIGASFLDTGAMYRAVTLAAIKAGIDMNSEDKLLKLIETTKFEFPVLRQAQDKLKKKGKILVHIDGIDVTRELRQPELTAKVWRIASSPRLREKLVQMQRDFAADEVKVVTEGRDQGTVAFPDADMKFFLTASAYERAGRRQLELKEKGVNQTLEQIQKAIEQRDKTDETREVGPLKPASDAIVIDTTALSIEDVVDKIVRCVEEKCSRKG
jgi:cytidylate kinase